MRWLASLALVAALLPGSARAAVDPACQDLFEDVQQNGLPDWYNEQAQRDFQANYFALVSSFSPLHAAIPHEGGHGSLGVDLAVLPPLSCEQRFVFDFTKTEDTNKSPILPKLVGSYSFPTIAKILTIYSGVAFLPPIPVNGTRNLVLSGEVGFGVAAHERFEVGARFHATMQRTYGDIATAFDEDDPAVEDVYVSSTWGFDALFSVPIPVQEHLLSPYAALGYLNASTFFLVGDNNVVTDNLHPYSGPAFSLGLDALIIDRIRLAGEFYGAPGGFSLPDGSAEVVGGFGRYGELYTARFRLAVEL